MTGPVRTRVKSFASSRVCTLRATFFVYGCWARAYPQLVAAEARAGCEVGDHTETHPPLALLSPAGQTAELTEAGKAIHDAGAPYPGVVPPAVRIV